MSVPINPPAVADRASVNCPPMWQTVLSACGSGSTPRRRLALLSGYTGEHPERRIEAAAVAPYPVAADIALEGVWLSDVPHQVADLEQAYDFSCGELTTPLAFAARGRRRGSRSSPSAAARTPRWSARKSLSRWTARASSSLRAIVDAAGLAVGAAPRARRRRASRGRGRRLPAVGIGRAACRPAASPLSPNCCGAGDRPPKPPRLAGERPGQPIRLCRAGRPEVRLRQIASRDPRRTAPDAPTSRPPAWRRRPGRRIRRIRAAESCSVGGRLWKGRIRLAGAASTGRRWPTPPSSI